MAFSNGPSNAAFADGFLYFDDLSLGTISRVSLQGGEVELLVDGGVTGEWAAGAGAFAWDTEPVEATPGSPNYVDQLHIRDSAGVTRDFEPISDGSVSSLSVDGAGNVYWIPSSGGGVDRWDHATQQVTFLAGARLGFVDPTHLYWLEDDEKTISEMPTSGGAVQTLATLEAPSGTDVRLAGSDAENLYVIETTRPQGNAVAPFFPATILGLAKNGGATWTIAEDTYVAFSNLASDEGDLYWTSVPAGTGDYVSEVDLMRAPKMGGGSAVQVAALSDFVNAIGVDDCDAYAVTSKGLLAFSKR